MKLALKIDIATSRGTREGAPRLAELLERHAAQATFLFTLGTDHPLGCVWLPGTNIGRRFTAAMRTIHAAGFETGIHAFDHAQWLCRAAHQKAAWTQHQMQRACERYENIFSEPAMVHGAAGWQMNVHAYRLTQRLGYRHCSDTRGTHPFMPVHNAEIMACPQLPTTLPTLRELLATPGITMENAAAHLLQLSENPLPTGHVYTLYAEIEGLKFTSVFEQLLRGWRTLGYELVSLNDYAEGLDMIRLPRHNVVQGRIAGCPRIVALQDGEFLV